jgi:hypothetical protein
MKERIWLAGRVHPSAVGFPSFPQPWSVRISFADSADTDADHFGRLACRDDIHETRAGEWRRGVRLSETVA